MEDIKKFGYIIPCPHGSELSAFNESSYALSLGFSPEYCRNILLQADDEEKKTPRYLGLLAIFETHFKNNSSAMSLFDLSTNSKLTIPSWVLFNYCYHLHYNYDSRENCGDIFNYISQNHSRIFGHEQYFGGIVKDDTASNSYFNCDDIPVAHPVIEDYFILNTEAVAIVGQTTIEWACKEANVDIEFKDHDFDAPSQNMRILSQGEALVPLKAYATVLEFMQNVLMLGRFNMEKGVYLERKLNEKIIKPIGNINNLVDKIRPLKQTSDQVDDNQETDDSN